MLNFMPFLFFNRLSVTKPRAVKFFQDLRANEAATLPVGVAGFCWGGKFVFLLCQDAEKTPDGKSLVDAGFAAHPSLVSVPADAEAIRLPLSVAVGDHDWAFPPASVEQVKNILGEKTPGKWEVVIFPGAIHGFAVRGSQENEEEVRQGMQAEDQAVQWYEKWFSAARNERARL
jgi:dienelactone hydrolase